MLRKTIENLCSVKRHRGTSAAKFILDLCMHADLSNSSFASIRKLELRNSKFHCLSFFFVFCWLRFWINCSRARALSFDSSSMQWPWPEFPSFYVSNLLFSIYREFSYANKKRLLFRKLNILMKAFNNLWDCKLLNFFIKKCIYVHIK